MQDTSYSAKQHIESLLFQPFKKKLRLFYLHPMLGAAVYACIFVSIQIAIGYGKGGFHNTPNERDIMEDPNFIPGTLGFIATNYFLYWVPTRFARVVQILTDRYVLTPENGELSISFDERVASLRKGKRISYLVPAALVLFTIVTTIYYWQEPLKYWYEDSICAFVVSMVFWIIGWAAIVVTLVNLLYIINILKSILNIGYFKVYPLHFDGRGGFYPLGTYLFRLTFFMWILGIPTAGVALQAFFDGTLSNNFLLFIETAVYIAGLPFVVFYPFSIVRRAMKRYRDKMLLNTSVAYLSAHELLHSSLADKENSTLKEGIDRLEMLSSVYNYDLKYPITPISLKLGGAGFILNAVLLPGLTIVATMAELL